jgi:FeS assembly SUF system protein
MMSDTTLTEEEIKEKALEAIKKVYDPEIPVNIYELGLVYEISVFPINNVFVQMTLTSPSCPAAQSIPEDVKRNIKEIEGVNDVTVEITFDPPWTQEMMSEAAKLELGFM